MSKVLTWEILKSRDSKYSIPRIERGEIEIWRGPGEDPRWPYIQAFPLEECPENACRCLHLDAKWINGSGLQCPDCQQFCFFGTFDALRWIIRQIRLLRSDTGCLLDSMQSHLQRADWNFSCELLMREAIEANQCQECCGVGEVYAGCYLCDAEAAGADHTHSKCDSYFAPCKMCDKGRNLNDKGRRPNNDIFCKDCLGAGEIYVGSSSCQEGKEHEQFRCDCFQRCKCRGPLKTLDSSQKALTRPAA